MEQSIAIVTFDRHIKLANSIKDHLGGDIILYDETVFERLFESYNVIIAIMASGIVVRKIAPYLKSKWKDPAVIVVDHAGKFAIPILGGHHGGNDTSKKLSEIGMIPVITTITD